MALSTNKDRVCNPEFLLDGIRKLETVYASFCSDGIRKLADYAQGHNYYTFLFIPHSCLRITVFAN